MLLVQDRLEPLRHVADDICRLLARGDIADHGEDAALSADGRALQGHFHPEQVAIFLARAPLKHLRAFRDGLAHPLVGLHRRVGAGALTALIRCEA